MEISELRQAVAVEAAAEAVAAVVEVVACLHLLAAEAGEVVLLS